MNDQAYKLRKMVQDKQTADQGCRQTFAGTEVPFVPSADTSYGTRARIIAVTSGKGGVGKTNLTVNLAIALAMQGVRTMIIDADLGMANVDVILGTSSKYSLLHLVEEQLTLETVLTEGPYGVKFLSGGSGMEQLANLDCEHLEKITRKLYACEDLADVILVDTGAGLSRNVLNFLMSADEVVLVTTPEPTAMTDAYAIMKAYSTYAESKHMKLVVNRVFDDQEGEDVIVKLTKTAERFLRLPVTALGEIYEDRNLIKAVKMQTPVLMAYPNTIAAKCIRAIAQNLMEGKDGASARGLRSFLEKLIAFLR